MGVKITNNAWAVLAAGITPTQWDIPLAPGGADRFPTLTTGDYAWATLSNAANQLEVVKITAIANNIMTVVRGQDGTTARSYALGDRVELRIPAALLNDKLDAAVAEDTYAPKDSPTITNPTFSGNVLAPTPTAGANDNRVATTKFVANATLSAVLPAQTGNAGKFITTDGTTASWAQVYPSLTNTNRKVLASNGTAPVWADPTTLDAVQVISASQTLQWNMANGGVADISLVGDRVMAAPTNMAPRSYFMIVRQDATGNRKLTWNSVYKFPGATPPLLSTAPNAVDVIQFFCDGSTMYGSLLRGMG